MEHIVNQAMPAVEYEKLQQFTKTKSTIILGTLDKEGHPFLSYAPYVLEDGKFYIYISKIADHYDQILAHDTVDVLFIDDETETNNLFARKRLRLQAKATFLGNEGELCERVFARFDEEFPPKMIKQLRTLDFSLFELTPTLGRYVAGFGLAYNVDAAEEQVNPVELDGHGHA